MIKPAALAILAATVLLGGCGLNDPYADSAASSTPPEMAEHAHGDGEQHLTEPDTTTAVTTPADVAGDTRGAERIARDFAATTLTYSPDTYAAQQNALRSRATGAMATQLQPPVPDEDTAATLKASALTSRARVLVSDVERSTQADVSVIVLLKVFTGREGARDTTPSYQPYRVRLRTVDGAWKVYAMDAP